jgi:ParB family chromosome partitioning protein
MKSKGLGKGLSSLIPDSYNKIVEKEKQAQETKESALAARGLQEVPLSSVFPNPNQPRELFDESAMADLVESIKEVGVLQPIIVKQSGEKYEVVCGERRYRACQALELDRVPVVIRDVADGELLELALIENIQRQDLNAVEESQGYLRLMEGRNLSQDEVAKRVGKSRSAVANSLRLLRLPEDILGVIREGRITSGHARAVLGLPTVDYQRKMIKRILKEGLSVRQVEEIVNRGNAGKRRAKRTRKVVPEIVDLEGRLAEKLGTQVRIVGRGDTGKIEIRYFSLDDLDRVMDLLQIERD